MQNYASKVSEGMALQLGCLELRYVPLGFWGVQGGAGRMGAAALAAGPRSSREGFGVAAAGRGFQSPARGGGGLCTKGKDVEGGMWGGGDAWRCMGGRLISLCSRRRFYKDMPQNALDKKSNFEFLE